MSAERENCEGLVEQEFWISPERQNALQKFSKNTERSLVIGTTGLLVGMVDMWLETILHFGSEHYVPLAIAAVSTLAILNAALNVTRGLKLEGEIYKEADEKRGQLELGFNKGPKGKFTNPIQLRK